METEIIKKHYWDKLSTLHGFEEGVHGSRCVKEKNDSY